MKQEVKDYLDEIINQGLENDFWFMTKQSMTDFYLIFTQSKVVETFNAHHKSNENFGTYYSRFFRENAELNKRYAAQGASDNTYRNAISAESLGLFYRENDSYTSGKVTPAYRAIERYVKSFEDSVKYKFLFERQIEKLCLNINPMSCSAVGIRYIVLSMYIHFCPVTNVLFIIGAPRSSALFVWSDVQNWSILWF